MSENKTFDGTYALGWTPQNQPTQSEPGDADTVLQMLWKELQEAKQWAQAWKQAYDQQYIHHMYRVDALEKIIQEQAAGLPKLPSWCFQPDTDSPGLYLQCETVEQRETIMRLLGASDVG